MPKIGNLTELTENRRRTESRPSVPAKTATDLSRFYAIAGIAFGLLVSVEVAGGNGEITT